MRVKGRMVPRGVRGKSDYGLIKEIKDKIKYFILHLWNRA